MSDASLSIAVSPSVWRLLCWSLSSFKHRMRIAIVSALLQCVVLLAGRSNLLSHARRELPSEADDTMQREMNRCVLQLLAVFSTQGHSGFSASYATSLVEKLMRFEPLGPLTGDDDEWFDHGDGMFQNLRCGHVFKQADRFNGQAYDLDGRIFREPSGACYSNSDSMVPITFPYTPKREYVDVPEAA